VLCASIQNKELRHYQGMTLAAIAAAQSKPEVETLLDLVADGGGVGCAYFMMSEENLRKQLALDWITFGSDSAATAAEGRVLEFGGHPRAYGNFARVLGHYVREEAVITLPEAIRRLSHLPASRLGLERRGLLEPGWYADIVVFDAATVIDRATFTEPHRYAEGMHHVVVNGQLALRDGTFTGTLNGKALAGPGKRP
jgi:N-acyl-D-amino-acid deacylase